MKTESCFKYETPSVEVLNVDTEIFLLVDSAIGGSTSEGFENNFDDIWGDP